VLAGKHRIVRVLGEGGMGVVLEAEHVLSGKRVAIKWLHPSSHDPSQAFGRMLREAQAAARVRHPNVVDVYDVSADGSSMFLVMELLEGETLAAALARGSIAIPTLIALLLEAMRGVAEAHRQSVIHRDIKPENIFLVRHRDREQPTPKVLDFGISKLVEAGSLSLTRTGDALGTPLYMSAEQLRGVRDLDARADVYAFGVILYEALTGRPPYEAETLSALISQVSTPPPSPKSLRPELPSALDRAVQHALMPDREQRTPSIDALIAELAPFAVASGEHGSLWSSTTSPLAPRASRSRSIGASPPVSTATLDVMQPRPRLSKVALACVAVALLAAAAWLAWPRARERAASVAAPVTVPTTQAAPSVTAPRVPTAATAPAVTPPQAPEPRREPAPAPKGAKAVHARDRAQSAAAAGASTAPAVAPAAPAPAAADAPPTQPTPSIPTPRLRAGRPQREEF
jgi:serine/threonine-protein kinase